MKISEKVVQTSTSKPWLITLVMLVVTFLVLATAAVPSVFPEKFPMMNHLQVDTDPENMLPQDEPVRVFHNQMKDRFDLSEMIVVGVINEHDANGVFNPESLKKIFELTEFAKTLNWQDESEPANTAGVKSAEILSLSTVDNVEGKGGIVKFEWMMDKPPQNREEALEIQRKASRIPFLNGTVISEDGKAAAIYLPITSKDVSYQISTKLQEKIDSFKKGHDEFHITGLPVANDTFGVEMFIQMAISAPMAMALIFLLMLFFFRKLVLIVSPMIIAMVSVILTMGLLIISGFTVHIMSSMIPIFIMPIAVLDSVHILSEFFDVYPKNKDRLKTIKHVMGELFMPMLYTSLTSMAGFASLALTPIPPVQIFGIFVALGVFFAWLLTILFIPAYIMLLPESWMKGFGNREHSGEQVGGLSKVLRGLGSATYRNAKLIIAFSVLVFGIALYGITKIQVNDNPVKWFTAEHPIRIADRELNKHFGGTYMAYLSLNLQEGDSDMKQMLPGFLARAEKELKETGEAEKLLPSVVDDFKKKAGEAVKQAESKTAFLSAMESYLSTRLDGAGDDWILWDTLYGFIDRERNRNEVFKEPETLEWMSKLQGHISSLEVVGKVNSLVDIVKTVNREVLGGGEENYKLPESKAGVAQTLMTFQNSHRPQDLRHFVTPDAKSSSMWVQLKSGNNKDMLSVTKSVRAYLDDRPPEKNIEHRWFGLTYINVVWQEKMVTGMLKAFAGSFLVVFLMMTVLFGSALWGFLAMIPLTVTISLIYGAVGFIGKDYDMPIAVLSSLTLGLAVDFAIHFLARSREEMRKYSDWKEGVRVMFDEPARAISRNIIVIAVGFTPLLFAPLVPYKTVGAFLATILLVAGVSTLIILPAFQRIFEKYLFGKDEKALGCHCMNCAITSATAVLVLVVNLGSVFEMSLNQMMITGALSFVLFAFVCKGISKSSICNVSKSTNNSSEGGKS